MSAGLEAVVSGVPGCRRMTLAVEAFICRVHGELELDDIECLSFRKLRLVHRSFLAEAELGRIRTACVWFPIGASGPSFQALQTFCRCRKP